MPRHAARRLAVCAMMLLGAAALESQPPTPFGGRYESLDNRRQQLVRNWLARFADVTGQKIEAAVFYDELLSLSAKTTFDAVTHALITTALTDGDGAPLGDALALVERVDTVQGDVAGARGDRQFRLYVRLTEGAMATLRRSREFVRGADNSVYHRGYPINFRQQGGAPTIQISIALDTRLADIDVDYRSARFPVALFNGHLHSSNSDVRAGNNSERHAGRWTGFESWWRSFFGLRRDRPPAEASGAMALPTSPRAGDKPVVEMVHDFLTAWLVEADQMAALGYISSRAYACLAQDADDPAAFDRGMAPFELLRALKDANEWLGPRTSLEGTTTGVNLAIPALRVVRQPHHARYVVYSVPDDIAADFDCESRLVPAERSMQRRAYGTYYGATFVVEGHRNQTLALLWARDHGYWKIVSWRVGFDREPAPAPEIAPAPTATRARADKALVDASYAFLSRWLLARDADGAMAYVSPRSYPCYDLLRDPSLPASSSPADAAARIRDGLASVARDLGRRKLDDIIVSSEPTHDAVQPLAHRYERLYSLAQVPDAIAEAVDCSRRLQGVAFPDEWTAEYSGSVAMSVQLRTGGGEGPVLRTLWQRDHGAWTITAYDIELP